MVRTTLARVCEGVIKPKGKIDVENWLGISRYLKPLSGFKIKNQYSLSPKLSYHFFNL